LGFFVEKLVRIKVGSVSLGALAPGELRPLSRSEVEALKGQVGLHGYAKHSLAHRPIAKGAHKQKGRP
jgi:hypothetical protein